MQKCISCRALLLIKAVVWFVIFALLLGSVIYLAARPISYNMGYHGETNDEYGYFSAERYFTRDNLVIIKNTNYDLPLVGFYYYKDGYVFDLRADTEEQCVEEIELINNGWDDAINELFYSEYINAYKMIFNRPDGVIVTYICSDAIVLTAVSAVASLLAAALSCANFVRYQREKREELPKEE